MKICCRSVPPWEMVVTESEKSSIQEAPWNSYAIQELWSAGCEGEITLGNRDGAHHELWEHINMSAVTLSTHQL